MNDIKHNILKDINEGTLGMKSRLRYVAHDYFFWFMSFVTALFGAIAVAVVLERISTYQIRPVVREPESISVFIQTLPYLWLGMFALLIVVAWFNIHKTARAYKLRNITLILSVLSASLLFGVILFAFGIGQQVDERSRERVPVLRQEFQKREGLRQQFIERRPGFERSLRQRIRQERARTLLQQRRSVVNPDGTERNQRPRTERQL